MNQITYMVGKSRKPSVYHVIYANLTNNKVNRHHMSPDVMCWMEQNMAL